MKKYKTEVISNTDSENLHTIINRWSKDDWKFIQAIPRDGDILIIFERDEEDKELLFG